MKFFKYVLASALGTILSGIILFFFLFILVIGSLSSAFDDLMSEKTASIKDHSVLVLDFKKPIREREVEDDFIIPGMTDEKIGLNKIIKNINKAKEDEKIEGIFLDFGSVSAGAASTDAIRNALVDFKESGKWILAYGESYSQKGYFLATVADKVYLNPEGGINFYGISYKPLFMKDMFDKIGIEMQVIRGANNKFKSAVEPFMYNKMSEANKLQSQQLINSIWGRIVNEIANSRNLSIDLVQKAADDLSLTFPEEALNLNFIDGLKYRDEINALLAEKLEEEELDTKQLVTYSRYQKVKIKKTKSRDFKKDKIAVIYAVGEITGGEGNDEVIGSKRISAAIKKARKDSTVKAIVFRVNSPGGSALASDVIWREVILAQETKPFVVSMGDLAASGGYYISCAADRIFAEPSTITGSIGVFGLLPNAQKLMNDKMGVYTDGVKTNKHSDMMSISKPLSPVEYKIIQKSVDEVYSSFISKVADGRNLRLSFVDSIGQGRIWTGLDALEIGLVDEIGGIEKAIDWAAESAGIEDYRVKEYPKMKNPIEEIIKSLTGEVEAKVMQDMLNNYELLEQYNYIQSAMNMKGIQARLPYYISF